MLLKGLAAVGDRRDQSENIRKHDEDWDGLLLERGKEASKKKKKGDKKGNSVKEIKNIGEVSDEQLNGMKKPEALT